MLGSIWDWVILIVVVLVVFGGSKKIPELARSLGRASGEFKRGQIEVEKELRETSSAVEQTSGRKDTYSVGDQTTQTRADSYTKADVEERIAKLERELEELKRMRDQASSKQT